MQLSSTTKGEGLLTASTEMPTFAEHGVNAYSVFSQWADKAWPYTFEGTLFVPHIAGGTPFDNKVAEGWLRTKMVDKDDEIRAMVARVMEERRITAEEATREVDMLQHLNGFKRGRCDQCPAPENDGNVAFCEGQHQLFIEGRQLKAALKEAASVAVAAGKLDGKGWGRTRKSLLGFLAEHVMVMDERLYLHQPEPGTGTGPDYPPRPGEPFTQPSEIIQRFVHTFRGNGIQYEEIVSGACFDFTIKTDWNFKDEAWAMIWLTGEQEGIGASRAQGFGRYKLVRWEKVA